MKPSVNSSNQLTVKSYSEKIVHFLSNYNIKLDVYNLLKDIDISNKLYNDVLDSFLLKYSDQWEVLKALYNKEYPYDIEINKKLKILNTKYEVEAENFYGVKFINYNIKNIIELCINNDVLIKGLLVDIKYNIEYLINFISKIKIGIDIKIVTDNISNIFIVIKQPITPIISKIALYEIYKKLKNPKEINNNFIFTKDVKISVLNNELLEKFYNDCSISDISFCIREYLDRNGLLIYFSTLLIDSISYIIKIENEKSTDYLREFLKFKFIGYQLVNGLEVNRTSESDILIKIDNLKYTIRYPPSDILNRLKFLNKTVLSIYYSKIGTYYYQCKNINSKLCFIDYKDYDVVLSKYPIGGSKKISYIGNLPSEIFDYKDNRVFIFYSKVSHTLLIKYKEKINREIFLMYLVSSCKFNYILFNY